MTHARKPYSAPTLRRLEPAEVLARFAKALFVDETSRPARPGPSAIAEDGNMRSQDADLALRAELDGTFSTRSKP
jgi:hypothetical protein